MLEHFIVYDVATGTVLFRGAVQPGYAQAASPADGQALLILPGEALRGVELDLNAVKAAMTHRVDDDAEALSLRFVSPGDARAGIYQAKAAEARAWSADETTPTPILTGEAAGRAMTIGEVAAQVLALADRWALIAGRIEGARLGAKDAIAGAKTIEDVLRGGTVDWSGVVPA